MEEEYYNMRVGFAKTGRATLSPELLTDMLNILSKAFSFIKNNSIYLKVLHLYMSRMPETVFNYFDSVYGVNTLTVDNQVILIYK